MNKRRWQDDIIAQIPDIHSEAELVELASKIREMFPKGKMALDNPTPWRQGSREIANKLLRFYQNYGTDYTKEEILKATELYVAKYNQPRHGNMRCSQHYIIKFPGQEDMVSDLATYIDMVRDGDTEEVQAISSNWLDEIR